MREPTEKLIETLARDARPVRPLAPPLVRASALISAILIGFGLVVAITGAGSLMAARLHDTLYMLELAGTFLTGATAIAAAATLSVPGRSYSWMLLPLPSALLWFGAATTRCVLNIAQGSESLFSSSSCFFFIAMVGMPLAVALFFVLRRSTAVNLASVMALGGLGVAALAATLLQFFHPEDTTAVDFATHLAATAGIVAFMMTLGSGALRLR